MKKYIPLLLTVFITTALLSFRTAPPKKIQGRVISFSESFPLEGVRVQVKGSDNLTGTQSDGSFSLELKPTDNALVFSLQGYKTKELKLEEKKVDYEVVLQAQ